MLTIFSIDTGLYLGGSGSFRTIYDEGGVAISSLNTSVGYADGSDPRLSEDTPLQSAASLHGYAGIRTDLFKNIFIQLNGYLGRNAFDQTERFHIPIYGGGEMTIKTYIKNKIMIGFLVGIERYQVHTHKINIYDTGDNVSSHTNGCVGGTAGYQFSKHICLTGKIQILFRGLQKNRYNNINNDDHELYIKYLNMRILVGLDWMVVSW